MNQNKNLEKSCCFFLRCGLRNAVQNLYTTDRHLQNILKSQKKIATVILNSLKPNFVVFWKGVSNFLDIQTLRWWNILHRDKDVKLSRKLCIILLHKKGPDQLKDVRKWRHKWGIGIRVRKTRYNCKFGDGKWRIVVEHVKSFSQTQI